MKTKAFWDIIHIAPYSIVEVDRVLEVGAASFIRAMSEISSRSIWLTV
jgi:hypothetical protein